MSRESILRALRTASVPAAKQVDGDGPWLTYADCGAQFAASLAAAGGRCLATAPGSLHATIEEIAQSVQARRTVSLVSGDPARGRPDVRPHDYHDVDLAVCTGTFGVAESGAVWISDLEAPEPALLFLAQHLALTLDSQQIVHNLHQAYERLSFTEPGFGTFIAGPSKTADIEQSLVIGAHGPRSLTVLLLQGD